MKLVTAIIRPSKLDEVIDALAKLGIDKLTVTEVRGCGGHGPGVPPAPSDEVEVAVRDAELQPVVAALRAAAATGRPGDGMILVADLLLAVRIRNRESGEQAL